MGRPRTVRLPPIHTEPLNQGWTIAKKTVLKLMRILGLVCKVRRKKSCNSSQGDQGTISPNLLNREFDADAPNQKWVTDVTEFSVGDRNLYRSPVMDLFDRQIISHTIGNSPNRNLTNTSLRSRPVLPRTWPAATRAFGQ